MPSVKSQGYVPAGGVWAAKDRAYIRKIYAGEDETRWAGAAVIKRADATVSALIAALDDACAFMPRYCVSGKCGNEDCTPFQIGRLLDSLK